MIWEKLGEYLNEWPSNQVPSCSGQKDEGEVGLIVSCDIAEVEDDRSHCCHHAAVEREDQCVSGEVHVAQLHQSPNQNIQKYTQSINIPSFNISVPSFNISIPSFKISIPSINN